MRWWSRRTIALRGDQPLQRATPVDLTTDGQTVCALAPEEEVEIRFRRDTAQIAQVGGATFYHRLREKFGRLSF